VFISVETDLPPQWQGVSVSIELITPQIAKDWLSRCVGNRLLKKLTAGEYASIMRADEWLPCWDAIAFNNLGVLINGQHRLEAIILSGKSEAFIVVRGLPVEVRDDIDVRDIGDRPKKRSIGDVMEMRHEKNSRSLASLLRALLTFQISGKPVVGMGTHAPNLLPQQARRILVLHPHVREFLGEVRVPALGKTQVNLLRYLFWNASPTDAEPFWQSLRLGEGLFEGDPRLTLRHQLELEEHRQRKASPDTRAAWAIKAWNKWMRGESTASIRFRPGGNRPEPFPMIEGFDYARWFSHGLQI
jgi:hypothetical protein